MSKGERQGRTGGPWGWLRAASFALLCCGFASCTAESTESERSDDAATRPIEALDEGRALDGRRGLELYAPDERAAVLEGLIENARYWGRAPEPTAELEQLLARHDASTPEGSAALYDALGAFVATHAVFTETEMQDGLHDLVVDGDEAVAYRIGHNPGGEFREEVRFVRIDGRWFMRGPAR